MTTQMLLMLAATALSAGSVLAMLTAAVAGRSSTVHRAGAVAIALTAGAFLICCACVALAAGA